jgi:hypothetical protein
MLGASNREALAVEKRAWRLGSWHSRLEAIWLMVWGDGFIVSGTVTAYKGVSRNFEKYLRPPVNSLVLADAER